MEAAAELRIRRIDARDGMTLRDLRLRSLADAPDAFGQPFAEAQERPEREWHQSARQSSHGQSRTWLIAEADSHPVGLVQGRKRRPKTLLLFSMWVDPSVRRSGVGKALIDSLEGWARDWGGRETVLWVYGGNSEAIRFYRELGFEVMQGGQDAESGARFRALAMRRDIHSLS